MHSPKCSYYHGDFGTTTSFLVLLSALAISPAPQLSVRIVPSITTAVHHCSVWLVHHQFFSLYLDVPKDLDSVIVDSCVCVYHFDLGASSPYSLGHWVRVVLPTSYSSLLCDGSRPSVLYFYWLVISVFSLVQMKSCLEWAVKLRWQSLKGTKSDTQYVFKQTQRNAHKSIQQKFLTASLMAMVEAAKAPWPVSSLR